MADVAKDLTAGTMGGVAQLLVGHPFDTVKVKLQSQGGGGGGGGGASSGPLPRYSGAMDAVKQTIAQEGARGLYRGMGAPLATVAVLNAILFTARGQMEALLRRVGGDDKLSVRQQAVCGAGAGAAVSILACPTELIKCRLQAQSGKYKGPLDVARHVLRAERGAAGLFTGLLPTLLREVPGNAIMFAVYEAAKRHLSSPDSPHGDRAALLTAGGLAGAAFWLSVYPADVVKSVIQVDDPRHPKYHGTIDAFRKLYLQGGLRSLFRGFSPAMARSVPANAACFLAYEITRSNLP